MFKPQYHSNPHEEGYLCSVAFIHSPNSKLYFLSSGLISYWITCVGLCNRFIFRLIFHSMFLCSAEQRTVGSTLDVVSSSSCWRCNTFRWPTLRLPCALLWCRHTLVLSALVFRRDVTVLQEIQNFTPYSFGNFRQMKTCRCVRWIFCRTLSLRPKCLVFWS